METKKKNKEECGETDKIGKTHNIKLLPTVYRGFLNFTKISTEVKHTI